MIRHLHLLGLGVLLRRTDAALDRLEASQAARGRAPDGAVRREFERIAVRRAILAHRIARLSADRQSVRAVARTVPQDLG